MIIQPAASVICFFTSHTLGSPLAQVWPSILEPGLGYGKESPLRHQLLLDSFPSTTMLALLCLNCEEVITS